MNNSKTFLGGELVEPTDDNSKNISTVEDYVNQQPLKRQTALKEMRQTMESDIPAKIGKPAYRAIIQAGYYKLEQLTKLHEKDLLKLHGVGPKAIDILRQALAEENKSFSE